MKLVRLSVRTKIKPSANVLSILTMGPENLIHQCCANSANGNFMEGGLKPAQRVCVGNISRVEKGPRVEQAYFLPVSKPIVLRKGAER